MPGHSRHCASRAVSHARIDNCGNEASRRSFTLHGFELSTTVRQSLGHGVCDPHRSILRWRRMSDVDVDLPSSTGAQSKSRYGRLQTAIGDRDQVSASFEAGELGACSLSARNISRTGNNRSSYSGAGGAARRSIHAGAAAQRRPFTQAKTTERSSSRDESGHVNAAADSVYSRIRRFGSSDAVVLDRPHPAQLFTGCGQRLSN
jgi:hypothetical protein